MTRTPVEEIKKGLTIVDVVGQYEELKAAGKDKRKSPEGDFPPSDVAMLRNQ